MPPAAEDSYRDALHRAEGHVLAWLGSVGDRHIGGCDEMMALERAGQLDPLLQAA